VRRGLERADSAAQQAANKWLSGFSRTPGYARVGNRAWNA